MCSLWGTNKKSTVFLELLRSVHVKYTKLDSSWNAMARGDALEGKWRGNWRMQWVASTLHTTSEHGVSSITTADAHTSAASSRLKWRPGWFKRTRPFRQKTKSGLCACTITFQLASTTNTSQQVFLWKGHSTHHASLPLVGCFYLPQSNGCGLT